jgi:hypothetical protein
MLKRKDKIRGQRKAVVFIVLYHSITFNKRITVTV